MKKLTKAQLADNAARLMAAHKVSGIWATQDKNFFLTAHDANAHNRELNKNPEDIWEVIQFGKAAIAVTAADATVKANAGTETPQQPQPPAQKPVKEAKGKKDTAAAIDTAPPAPVVTGDAPPAELVNAAPQANA